jgi:KipI family sensor histidine kinase inhibitor
VRIREAGDSAAVADLEAAIDPAVNARAIGIAAAVRAQRIPGVRDVVSTFHSVAVHFDPLATDGSAVQAALRTADEQAPLPSTGRLIEVPVMYGGETGPDLVDVAASAKCSPAEVVARHTSRSYRVYMLGFLPGYPYLGTVDEAIATPRRATPRVRVPAGSVGLAGRQTGIYPRESPGGWQIIGRTSLTLFDPDADPPALFAPGDEVRFVPVSDVSDVVSGFRRTRVRLKADTTYDPAPRFITVLQPGLLTTIQDEGRRGYQHLGVPVAGPMDLVAHRLANAVLGNPRDAATLEGTLVGPELRVEQDVWVALAGADLQPSIDGSDAPMGVPVKCRAGSVLRFGARRRGARVYIAVDGGIDVPVVLGSRATHRLSGLGGVAGRAVRVGDRLPLGSASGSRGASVSSARVEADSARAASPLPTGGARLRILPGPQFDHFDPAAFDALQRGCYTVSPQSDRMGYRLSGARVPAPPGEMISNAVFLGGVQVPPAGEPILLMADRQTTGGYPQLAVVITADVPLAAQLVPGDSVAFEACSHSEAIAALRAQEGLLGAIR